MESQSKNKESNSGKQLLLKENPKARENKSLFPVITVVLIPQRCGSLACRARPQRQLGKLKVQCEKQQQQQYTYCSISECNSQ